MSPGIISESLQKNIFTQTLEYFSPKHVQPRYTGTIAETSWQRGSEEADTYAYTYDRLGRLVDGRFISGGQIVNVYGERDICYDKNTNILSLTRYNGSHTGTQYRYTYDGNRKQTLTSGTSTETAISYGYQYDIMGNISKIGVENLLISYNYLNLPKLITKTGTPISRSGATYVVGVARPTASYLYLADGTKVQAIGETGQGYEYLGSLRLCVNGSNADIESIPFAGGRIVKTTNGYEPQYYITDHLGSTRTVVKPNATVVAEFDYMPYGTQHAVAGAPITEADYKYTGKEQQTAFGLDNLYDSQARFQYVTDGSFMSHDPLSATFSNTSPYMYCGGDPINRVDQDGREFTLTSIPIIHQLLGVANEYEQRYNTELFLLRSSLQFGMRSDLEIAQIEAQMGQINQRISEIANMRQEIYNLMTSKQLYNITTNALRPKADSTIDIFGYTEYDVYNNYVSINICTNDKDMFWGTVAHELKHAYQFDAGQMSFNKDIGCPGWYYDYDDEIEAHRRGAAFGLPEDIDPEAYYDVIHKTPTGTGPINYINAIYNRGFQEQNIYRYNHFSYGYIYRF